MERRLDWALETTFCEYICTESRDEFRPRVNRHFVFHERFHPSQTLFTYGTNFHFGKTVYMACFVTFHPGMTFHPGA